MEIPLQQNIDFQHQKNGVDIFISTPLFISVLQNKFKKSEFPLKIFSPI